MNTNTTLPHSGNGHVPAVHPPQEDLVLTPGGYKPRSKVYLLEKNFHVASRDGQLWLVNSAKGEIRHLGPQAPPPGANHIFSATPAPPAPPLPSALPADAWVAYTEFRNLAQPALDLFTAEWIVPEPPIDQADQTFFIFIGLQNNEYILQPVLQWGPSHAGGGQFWTISNWYTDGTTEDTVCTHAVEVQPGTKLQARIELLGQVNRLFTYKVSFPGFPALDHIQDSVMELFWAFVVLESYNVDNEDQYPSVQQTQVDVLGISAGNTPLSPAWRPVRVQPRAGIHPQTVIQPSAPNIINIKYR